MVQDLVHPSMYPFVYGIYSFFLLSCFSLIKAAAKTKFIQEEVVGVTDAVDKWSGKGEVVPETEFAEPIGRYDQVYTNGDRINREYWSRTYQWLPANLAFQDDGTVRFTSYINNLHPRKYADTYRFVERLIHTAIPAWERVLSGRVVTVSGNDQERIEFPPGVG
jgi:hypothetical protein